jgi:hypothetical protein
MGSLPMNEQAHDYANDAPLFLIPGKLYAILSFFRYLAASAPLLLVALLYSLSWRVALHIGHWPRYMHDDPKFIFTDDPLYDWHFNAIALALLWTFCSVLILPILEVFLYRPPVLRTWLIIGFYILGLLLLGIDVASEGSRMAWWLD